MKTIVGIFGAVLILLSIVLFFVAFALSNRPQGPWGFFVILAVVSLVVGIVLDRFASGKICPSCAEKVKTAALTCRYCAHKFISS